MKKIAFILFTVLLSYSGMSQNSEKKEKIKSLKIAFITEQLELSEAEAQKFWPIFNAYESKKDQQRHEAYGKYKQISDALSEAQANAILKDLIALEKERHKSRIEYIESLMKVMPAKKIIKLRTAEDDFNRKMLHEYKNRHSRKSQ